MGNQVQTYFQVGQPLDAVVYNELTPLLKQAGIQHALSAIVYTADSSAILGTLVNGKWIV
jgi:formimidoylglutamate deiminase